MLVCIENEGSGWKLLRFRPCFNRSIIPFLHTWSNKDGMSFVGYPPQPVAAGYFYPPYGLIPPGGPPQVASPYSVPLQGRNNRCICDEVSYGRLSKLQLSQIIH